MSKPHGPRRQTEYTVITTSHYSGVIMSAMASKTTGVSSVYSTVQGQMKENIKAPRQWSLWWEFTVDRWIPRTNGQWRGSCFHLMTSSWGIKTWPRGCCRSRIRTSSHTSDRRTGNSGCQSYSYSWWSLEGAIGQFRRTLFAVSYLVSAHNPHQRYKKWRHKCSS